MGDDEELVSSSKIRYDHNMFSIKSNKELCMGLQRTLAHWRDAIANSTLRSDNQIWETSRLVTRGFATFYLGRRARTLRSAPPYRPS